MSRTGACRPKVRRGRSSLTCEPDNNCRLGAVYHPGSRQGLCAAFVERDLAAAQSVTLPRSANDRPGIALIGCGDMGRNDATNAARFGDIVAVCDVDESRLAAAAAQFTKDGKSPDQFTDFRKLLERPDVQVIVQATPDHWHTLVNLAAAASRKDIYGEKPLTLTINEGKRVVQAVHLIVIALQLGRPLGWDPAQEVFIGSGASEANARLARPMRQPYDYTFAG
ncbi:MAG: Gfo/Idh/MocA family oxidoreductase [Vicinamibacterales bacterium]